MENEKAVENQVQSAPVNNAGAPEAKKKTSPWVWIVGGCLLVAILTLGAMGIVGYLGYKKVKQEIKKQTPAMEEFKQKMEKAGEEADKLDKKSRGAREALPSDTSLPEAE